MVMPKADLLRSELYADWFRPHGFYGVMAAPALFKNKASVVLVAFRGRRREDFERGDLKKIKGLAYHFGQALRIRVDREQAESVPRQRISWMKSLTLFYLLIIGRG
jgi:hypothetical protein